jgi:hypothetical protein
VPRKCNTSIYINKIHRWMQDGQGQDIRGYDSMREESLRGYDSTREESLRG